MREARVAAVAAFLLLTLFVPVPEAVAASAPVARYAPGEGADWLVAEVVPSLEDWTYEGGTWHLRIDVLVQGVPADALTAVDLVWFSGEGFSTFLHPFVWQGDMWLATYVGTSAPPEDDRFLAVAAVERAAPEWEVRTAVGNKDVFGPTSDALPLGSGSGAQLARLDQWASLGGPRHAFNRGVAVEDEPGMQVGDASIDHRWSARVHHEVDEPSWHAAFAHASTRVGVGEARGAHEMDGEVENVEGLVVTPVRSGSGVFGSGIATGAAAVELEVVLAADSGVNARVSALTFPFDPNAHGYPVDRVAGRSYSGMGPMVGIGGCWLPDDVLMDPAECTKVLQR